MNNLMVLNSGKCVICSGVDINHMALPVRLDEKQMEFFGAPKGRVVEVPICKNCGEECFKFSHPSGFPQGQKLASAVKKSLETYDFKGEDAKRAEALKSIDSLYQKAVRLIEFESFQEALNHVTQAMSDLREKVMMGSKSHEETGLDLLAQILESTGRFGEAIEHLQKLRGIREARFGKDSKEYGDILFRLGRVVNAGRSPSEAEGYLRQALEISKKCRNPNEAQVKSALIKALVAQNKLGDEIETL